MKIVGRPVWWWKAVERPPMSQRSHIAINGSTAIWPCSAACNEPWRTSRGSRRRERPRAARTRGPEDELLLGHVEREQIEHGVVRHALLLVGHDLLGYRDDSEGERHSAGLALFADLLDVGLGLPLGLGVPIAFEAPDERARRWARSRSSTS